MGELETNFVNDEDDKRTDGYGCGKSITAAACSQSIVDFLDWITSQMLTYNNGSWGMYERIRIDKNQRVCWVRPDCNSELAKVLMLYNKENESAYNALYHNTVNWLLSAQKTDSTLASFGTFPFWLADGFIKTDNGEAIYQNDNGKILINLVELYAETRDERLLKAAKELAGFWAGIQRADGTFDMPLDDKLQKGINIPEGKSKGPCFVLWLMAGFYKLYDVTEDARFLAVADKALTYVLSVIKGKRILTTYELLKTEDWRPASSENAIAVYALSVAYKTTKREKIKEAALKILEYLALLQDESGGITNCEQDSLDASLNCGTDICDFVYTQGFAILAFIEAYEAFSSEKALDMAKKLAKFLVDTQCRKENPLWDGGWRGSYSIKEKTWAGRCDQNNHIDEGGLYSVYSGWAGLNIVTGLMRIKEYI